MAKRREVEWEGGGGGAGIGRESRRVYSTRTRHMYVRINGNGIPSGK